MDYLIWAGAGISALGLVGILFSIALVRKARRQNLDDAALRQRIAQVLPLNLGALFISVIGLMCVVIGVLLG